MRSALVCVGRRGGVWVSGAFGIALLVLLARCGVDGGTAVRTRNVTEGQEVTKTTEEPVTSSLLPLTPTTVKRDGEILNQITDEPVTLSLPPSTPTRVKCYYFKSPPVRTYCHVLNVEGPITASEATRECSAISMNLLSIKTTPQHLICTLVKIFKLDESKLWIADISDTPDTSTNSTLSRCNLEVLDETVTNVDRSCTNCTIAVVCEAGFYHSKRSNCVTVEEDKHEVEYCYHKEPVGAYESAQECASRSTELMNETNLGQSFLLNYVRPIVHADLEFWVDMRKEDLSGLSGVIAFNTVYHDWNNSCITVWFGRNVPWFFKRNCSDSFQIVCQDTHNEHMPEGVREEDELRHFISDRLETEKLFIPANLTHAAHASDCPYHPSQERPFGYCVPRGRKFNLSDGIKFCNTRFMELLRGSTLSRLFYVDSHLKMVHNNSMDRYLVWDKNFRGGSDAMATVTPVDRYSRTTLFERETCTATSLHDPVYGSPLHKELPCGAARPYICRRQKRVSRSETADEPDDGPSCDYVARIPAGVPGQNFSACLNMAPLTYEESVTKCNRVGMKLLGQSLRVAEYEDLIHGLYYDMHHSEAVMYWLRRDNGDHERCAVLVRNGGTIIQKDFNCEDKLPFVCVLHCYPTKQYEVAWPLTTPGSMVTLSCPNNAAAKMKRMCLEDGQWGVVNDAECVSDAFKSTTKALMNEKNFTIVTSQLADFSANIKTHSDLKSAAEALADIMSKQIEAIPTEERPNKTREIAGSLVTAINGAMTRTNIWNQIVQGERLITAVGLINVVEDTVLKMLVYQSGRDAVSIIDLSNGNTRVQAAKITGSTLKDKITLPVSSGNNQLRLPPNFLSGGDGDVSIMFAEYPSVSDILHPPERDKKSMKSRLATAVLTATVVHKNKAVTNFAKNIDLIFKRPQGYTKPECVFLTSDTKWKHTGCQLKSMTSDEVVCSCNHLTNFAVLMSPTPGMEDDRELHWITVVGCAISIVCLALCIAIFTFYRHLKGIRNTIHRNLCVSLLVGEILLLLGLDKETPFRKTDQLCTTMAFLLHFFFLSAFAWMALEGCNIIVLLWKVFNQKRTYYERYYLAGYGIPLIISCTSLGIRHEYYGKGRVCWLPVEDGVRFSFIGPVAVVICLNAGALGLVHWKMSHVRMVVEKSTLEKARNWVRGTLILLPILGLTWLLGFLMLGSGGLYRAGAYLFAAFNSLQGLGIFVCHVLMSKKTRDAIYRSMTTTGSIVKGSMSPRSSRSGTSSTKATWCTFSRSSNSTKVTAPPGTASPNCNCNSNSQCSSSDTDTDVNACHELECWRGARFKYELKVSDSVGDNAAADARPDITKLPRFRPARHSEA